MNKIIIVALCALAAVASAQNGVDFNDDFSELKLTTSDEAETAGLNGPNKVFAPFCTQSRDFIFNDIETNTNKAASDAFAMLFNMVETLGQAALNAISYGNKELTPVIANPQATRVSLSKMPNQLQAAIENGRSMVARAETQPQSFVEAFKSIVSASSQAVATAYNEKISQIKDVVTTFGSVSTLAALCDKIASYEQAADEQFQAFIAQVAEEDASLVKPGMTLNMVPCKTSTLVVRLNSICSFARVSAPSITKLMATRQA